MSHHALRATIAGAVIGATCATTALAGPTDVPLIPRDVLFGNPDRAGVQISPDGKHLSYLAPVDGVMNVWVAPIGDLAAARPVTDDRKRGIRIYFWAFSDDDVIYLQDTGGDENWQLFVTNVESGKTRDLTNDPKVQTQIQEVSYKHPGSILIGMNARDPRYHDLYKVDLDSGKNTLVQKNDGFLGFLTDKDYHVHMGVRPLPDGGLAYLQRTKDGDWTPFAKVSQADALTTQPLGFNKDGSELYMLDSRDRNTAALETVNIATGKKKVLAEDPRADVRGAMIQPTERTVQAASIDYTRKEWKVLDENVRDDFTYLRTIADADFDIVSRTLDDGKWIVAYTADDGPVSYYLYDRSTRMVKFLFVNRPKLEKLPLAKMHPVVVKSRDGLDLVCYYTLPVWSDRDADGKPSSPLATVLFVHGGPWARDEWGYNAIHQWLANRGYAVLSVNYRGSTGFGKDFLNAGNLQWAAKMHDDLIDAVDWAVKNGIADKDRVAIMGGSYGGYATLVGLTFTPKEFAAGVDICGPSNLITLMRSIPPYWAAFLDQFRTRVGDIKTAQGRILLRSRSPLTHVDEIVRPLLIGQGANDPRVKEAEAQQIVDAMKKRNIPVTYVRYPDEGHGFARPENRLSFFAVTEIFLAQHLGGVYEEIGNDFKGSTIEVPTGARDVPGVVEALKQIK